MDDMDDMDDIRDAQDRIDFISSFYLYLGGLEKKMNLHLSQAERMYRSL